MSIDRLGDIPTWAYEDGEDENENPQEDEPDLEMAEVQQKQQRLMENFFREVETIKTDIDLIKQASKKIHSLNEEAISATTTDQENEVSNRLRPLVDQTNKRAKRTKNLLGLLKEESEKLEQTNGLPTSDLRVRKNLCQTLTRKFIDEMKNYQLAQQQYKTDIKEKVKRQVKVVKPDATDEDVDRIMKSDGGRDALYKETVLAGGVNDQVKTTYAKVAGKYQDVLTLEQSVAELHQMFLDFALLTDQQGELLDQIEFQVKEAADYIEDGNVEVFEAIEIQKKVRKKQCMLLLIIGGSIAFIMLAFIIR